MFIKVTEYAEQRKVTPRYIRKLIRDGKITRQSWKMQGKQYRVNPALADKDLSENLDRIYNPPGSRPKKADQPSWIEIQAKAAEIASTGEETGHLTPWPVWAARYMAALDPDRVDLEQISKTEWRLTIHDVNTETERPTPWTVTMEFDFNPDI